jgi:hypothetical protein
VEREEDGLSCSGVEEIPAGGAKARWRGRCGGEGNRVEREVAEAAQRSAVTESFRDARRVDEQISCDCWVASRPTIDTVWAEGRSISSITVCKNNYTNYIYSRVCKKVMRCVCVYIRAKTKIGYGEAAMALFSCANKPAEKHC